MWLRRLGSASRTCAAAIGGPEGSVVDFDAGALSPAHNADVSRLAEQSGVRIPTLREARRSGKRSESDIARLHAGCAHVDRDCPIEAAASARLWRWDWQVYGAFLLLLWVAPLVVHFAAPKATVVAGGDVRASVAFAALAMAIGSSFFLVPRLLSARTSELQALSAAASGPSIDPWHAMDALSSTRVTPSRGPTA